MRCKICGAESAKLFQARVLSKYDVDYFKCDACGFIQTEAPYWLSESYASAINEIDIGVVNRAVGGAKLVEGIILSAFDAKKSFIDYGGGYGILTRMMRDLGYDFYWQDRYCENKFAKHFEAKPGARYELLTTFEVFEHLADPHAELSLMLEYSRNILFSTLLAPPNIKSAQDWWYFTPEYGQHIAFYTAASLKVIAARYGLHFATDGSLFHLLSEKPISNRAFRFFVRESRLSAVARRILRRRSRVRSLLSPDFEAVSGYSI